MASYILDVINVDEPLIFYKYVNNVIPICILFKSRVTNQSTVFEVMIDITINMNIMINGARDFTYLHIFSGKDRGNWIRFIFVL